MVDAAATTPANIIKLARICSFPAWGNLLLPDMTNTASAPNRKAALTCMLIGKCSMSPPALSVSYKYLTIGDRCFTLFGVMAKFAVE